MFLNNYPLPHIYVYQTTNPGHNALFAGLNHNRNCSRKNERLNVYNILVDH